MNTTNTAETNSPQPQPEYLGDATYCMEDDKLRLYVGRVPRPLYDRLRDEGWTSTPKQGCDFVAVWTPNRRDTALELCGHIGDEDQSPAERAADRAERFGGYRDKRLSEAFGHADRYDALPTAHGFQSAARAERAAARHDRIGTKAVDAWDKAEYWVSRTRGVIDHALYKSTPSVRAARIRVLESELRKRTSNWTAHQIGYRQWKRIHTLANSLDHVDESLVVKMYDALANWNSYLPHPTDPGKTVSERYLIGSLKMTVTDATNWVMKHRVEPAPTSEWMDHLRMRIEYEKQMLAACGGTASDMEIVVGGWWAGFQIHKVNRSPVDGKVISLMIRGKRVEGWQYKSQSPKGADCSLHQVDVVRSQGTEYRPPTPEDLALLKEHTTKALAAKRAASPTIPLINPTLGDALKLQVLLNRRNRDHNAESGRDSTPMEMTQEEYSKANDGLYTKRVETEEFRALAAWVHPGSMQYREKLNAAGPAICKVRVRKGTCDNEGYLAPRVIILTDKAQKPLPPALWVAHTTETKPQPASA